MNLSYAPTNWLHFPESLPGLNFTSLQVLDLSYNNFNPQMPSWLFKISTLKQVFLYRCEFKGSIPEVSWGRSLCNLRYMDLSSNMISGDINEFVDALAGCSNNTLGYLGLSSNHLKGNLPDSLCSFKYLTYLGLGQNSIFRFTSKIYRICQVCAGPIFQLYERLYELNLYGNLWEGVITESHFRNLSRLILLFIVIIHKQIFDLQVKTRLDSCVQFR